jgi:hypothetical protein
MGNTCGRSEADGEGGEGAGCYSGPWGLLTTLTFNAGLTGYDPKAVDRLEK